jgi:hypothetical protein
LFTTAYTRNAAAHHGVLDPGAQLIGKPFTVEELATRVRECWMRQPRRAAASSKPGKAQDEFDDGRFSATFSHCVRV